MATRVGTRVIMARVSAIERYESVQRVLAKKETLDDTFYDALVDSWNDITPAQRQEYAQACAGFHHDWINYIPTAIDRRDRSGVPLFRLCRRCCTYDRKDW